MDVKVNAILSVALLPQIIWLIVKNDGLDDVAAVKEFCRSKTYEALEKEETKMWHFSALTIYSIWKTERELDKIIYPEE